MTAPDPQRPALRIGVDLGTSNSLAAYMLDGQPIVLRNSLDELLTPSVVAFNERDEVLVGSAARALRVTRPERCAAHFKRDMGTSTKYRIGKREFSPEQLSSLVLRQIREEVEKVTGARVEEAVVTVPAYFGEAQRRATALACELAGLPVERIINEPTAAALAYGLQNREADLQAIVLDLGGGTFDVSVLELMDGVVEIRATAGDARLGG